MKKLITGIISFALALTAMAAPWGQSAEGVLGTNEIKASAESSGDYEYELLKNGTVAITYYRGSESKVTIPSKINGKKVTYIGPGAFINCTSLTSLTIPNGVTDIGYGAFLCCMSLNNIKFSASVKNIDDYAFYGCIELADITLPNSLKSVGELAFGDCWSIRSVSIPKSVSAIGDLAFGYRADYYDEDNNIVYYDYVTSFKIKCYANSKGEAYAKENKFSYSYLDTLPNVSGFKGAPTSSSSIKLTWNKVSGAKGYIIYQYNNSTKTWVRIAKTTTTANTYKISKLSAGTEYKFAVKAHKTANGQEISSVSYPTLTVVTNPAAVTGFKVSSTSSDYVKLSWDKVKSARGYIIYQYDNSKKIWNRIKKTFNTSNSYTVTGLKSGIEYKFAVRAYRIDDSKTVLSPAYPQASSVTKLTKVSGIKSSCSDGSVKLSWNKVSGAQGYIVYQYIDQNWTRLDKITGTSYNVKNLASGKTYWFAVKAYKNVNGKEVSSVSYDTYKTTTKPAKVDFTLTSGSGKATLKWNNVSGATGYIVYYKTSAKGSWQKLKTTKSTSFSKTGLSKGKTYYFTVKAYKNYNGVTYNGAYTEKSVKIK